MMSDISCVIVCGGDFGRWEYGFLRALNPGTYLIAADHGIDYLLEADIIPDVCIGDFDSASGVVGQRLFVWEKEYGKEVIRLNPVKDDTDSEAALHLALERTKGSIVILGGLGGCRFDHTLSNVHILLQAALEQREAFLLNETNRIRVITTDLLISKSEQYGKYISLFPLAGQVSGLTLEGFAYPLHNAVLSYGSSLGTSNEITAEEGRITFSSGELVVIESR